MKKEKILKIFYLFLLLQPFLDLITSLMTRFLDISFTLGIFVRGILFVVSCVYILFLSKSKYKKISSIYLIILFIFSILYFMTKPDIFSNKSFIITEFTYMFKYYYTVIMFFMLLNFFDEFKPNNRKIFKLLQFALCTYCFIITIANLTGTAFGTYTGGKGNTGWFYSGNEIGIIVTLLFPLLFLLVNRTTSFKCLIYIVPIVYAIEIIGTKTSMLGLLLPTTIFLIYYLFRIKNGKSKQFIITLIMLLIIGISSSDLPVITNVKNSVSRYENRQNLIKNEKKQDLKKYSDKVLTAVILSDRDFFQKNISKIYNESSLQDNLFGIGFVNRKSIDDINVEKLIEMDIYDIFYRYGIVGSIIYFVPFIVAFGIVLKMSINIKFRFNMKQLVLGYMCAIGIFIAFIVGHTLGAPAVAFYLDLTIVMLLYYLKNGSYKVEIDDKKVTILALHLGTGGIEKYLSSLVKILNKDYSVEIVSTYKLSENPSFDFDNAEIKYLINDYPRKEEFKNNLKNRKMIVAFKQGISLFKILLLKYYKNILFVEENNSKYIITTRSFHNRIVGNNKNRDTIAIATEHNYHNNDKKYVKDLINSCQNIDYLILVSQELSNYYQSKLKNTKCIFIPNTIDNIPKYKSKKVIKNRLISIGRLVEEKGYDDLIDVIEILKNKNFNIKLDIYGDGYLKNHLNEKIKQKKLNNTIKIKGFYAHNKLLDLLTNYDLYVMSSVTESFGLVLIEAMSRSLPCIAFDDANGAKNILSNGNGILIKNRNKEQYANEVVKLLSNVNQLNKVSKKGYDSISTYEINVVKNQWLDLLKNSKKNN